MSDLESGLDHVHISEPASPIREGLPPGYRMRADAHYVEELDSALFGAPIRHLAVRSIDPMPREHDSRPSAEFVDSVRRHGVLQPLLVRSRGSRFQVMSGGKRLAAAVEAGLTEVPCLVERIDDEQARILAAAANVPSTPRDATPPRPESPAPDLPFSAFADCLTAVASSAGLLSSGSLLTQAVAADLVKAEATRALHLLKAVQLLRGEVRPVRRPVYPRLLLQRVVEESEPERRLCGLTLTIEGDRGEGQPLLGDEDVLATCFRSLVVALPVLLPGQAVRSVSLKTSMRDGDVVIGANHHGAELPAFWRAILAEEGSRAAALPGESATAAAVLLLRAARQGAVLHGGRMNVDCANGMTSLVLSIPAATHSA